MRAWSVVGPLSVMAIAFGCGDESHRRFDPDLGAGVDAGDHESSAALPSSPSANALCEEAAANARLAGCHFMQLFGSTSFPTRPVNVYEPVWGCFAVVVANPNDVPVRLRVRRGAEEADGAPFTRLIEVDGRRAEYAPLPGGSVPPHAIAVVSTVHIPSDRPDIKGPPNSSLDCPGPAFIEEKSGAEGNIVLDKRGQAIELLADAPIFALNIHQYQRDGGKEPLPLHGPFVGVWPPHPLHPVHLWRSTLLDTGAFKAGRPKELENPDIPMGQDDHFSFTLWLGRTSVVAAEDETTITRPTLDGGTATLTLDRGGIDTRENQDDLIGRAFSADKPIAIVHTIPTVIPWDFPFGDELDGAGVASAVPHEPLWGSEYVAVRHADRWEGVKEEPPWRIVGGVDGTTLTYEPAKPAGAPERIDRGALAIFEANEPFVVRSQDGDHPFFFGSHMTGGKYLLQRNGQYPNDVSRGGGVSAAEVPLSRWAKRYPFFALLNWPEQYLLVVRRQGGKDVVLDCAGVIGGWQPAGTRFEYAYVPLVDRSLEPVSYGASRCHAGPHWIESEDPFRATIWGVTTVKRLIEESIEASTAYAIPLLGDDRPATTGAQ